MRQSKNCSFQRRRHMRITVAQVFRCARERGEKKPLCVRERQNLPNFEREGYIRKKEELERVRRTSNHDLTKKKIEVKILENTAF